MQTYPDRRSGALTWLVALTVLFGLQCLRVWLPLLGFLVRDRLGWSSVEISALAFGVLLSGCLAPVLVGRFGLRRSAWLIVGGLALARLEIQLWQGDPVVELVAACVGVAAFASAAPVLLQLTRAVSRPRVLSVGWIAGLVADQVMHGLYGTWDVAWRHDLGSLALILGLTVAAWLALRLVVRDLAADLATPDGASSLAWVGVWPLVYLYLWTFGNPARLAELGGADTQSSWRMLAVILLVTMLGQCLGSWQRWPRWTTVLSTAVLVAACWDPWPAGEWALLYARLGAVALAVATMLLLERSADGESRGSPWPLAAAHGGALVLFFLLVFVTSSGWDLRLPIAADRMPIVAAIVASLALADPARLRRRRPSPAAGGVPRAAAAIVAVLGIALSWPVVSARGESLEPGDWPLRVATYNVYCGVGPDSRFDLEALAVTLEAATLKDDAPDVVILQEVSRGWLVNGNVDLVGWLADRLDMNFVFHGTADPTWGNAVMTRLPIRNVRRWDLPPRSLLLRRGVLDVELEVGEGDHVRILGTHLHHPREGGPERLVQSERLAEIWDGTARTVIAGDLNALPEEPEIRRLREAGLRDALDVAGVEPGFTYPSWQPVRRIDYVFLSPDLTADEAWVSPSTASDHAAVITVVQPSP